MSTYTVKKGDTLSAIAKANNTTVSELAKTNNIKDVNKIYTGNTLEIPSAVSNTPTVSVPTSAGSTNLSTYSPSALVTNKQATYDSANNAVTNYGDYNSAFSEQLNSIYDKIMNREKFSYDLNDDMVYQNAKEQYTKQGKMAMMDTMGQAASLTGGYGSSYASTAGNQAYQNSLTQLNDIIPELYNTALNRYSQEGTDMYNQLNTTQNMDDSAYGKYTDKYGRLVDVRDNALTDYGNEKSFDQTSFTSDRDYNESVRQYAEEMAYQKQQDAIANSQWEKEFALAQAKAASSGSSSSSKSKSTANTTTKTVNVMNNEDVMEKNLAQYQSNKDLQGLSDYLDSLESEGKISAADADMLFRKYKPTVAVPTPLESMKSGKAPTPFR